MLIEDIHIGIVPYTYDDYNSQAQVKLTQPSQPVEDMICNALPTPYGRSNDLRSAVCGFIRYAAHVLATYGELNCEIVYYFDNHNKDKLIGFELSLIPPGVLKRFFWFYYYLSPKDEDSDQNRIISRIKRIDPSTVFILELPKKFGSPSSYRRNMLRLAKLGQNIVPDFAMEEMRVGNDKRIFDFSIYRRSYEEWVARTTKHLGWTARGTFREGTTEFFRLLRHLRFRKLQSKLRVHILNELNAVLQIIGKKIGFKASITMDELSEPTSYDEKMHNLQDGKLPFMDAWKTN